MSRVQQEFLQGLSSTDKAHRPMLTRAVSSAASLRVGIIGAGVSGLRCASYLLEHGIDVTVYEARKRVGGRLGQGVLNGHLVDLGPNWIHGTKDNDILRLARQTNTVLHSWEERAVVYDEDGTQVRDVDAGHVYETFWGIVSDAFQYSNKCSESIDPRRSFMEYVTEKTGEKFQDEKSDVAARLRRLVAREADIWGAFIGSSPEKQSLRYFWLEEGIEGENPFCAETFAKILEVIARPAVKAGVIKFEHEVTKVQTPQESGHDQVKISTALGSTEHFDEVVVTTPLGWLKGNTHKFEPPLPKDMSQAIDNIGYGNLDKVYIAFQTAFWEQGERRQGSAMTGRTDSNFPNVEATSLPIHQPSKPTGTSQYPGFVQWLQPHYDRSSNPAQWTQRALNYAALPGPYAQPCLLFYIYAECARHIGKLVSEASDTRRTAALCDFFRPYYSMLPNYSADSPDCQPVAALATAWSTDEFAGYGSYSNFQVGLENGPADIETMRYGLPERRLWFAGEHTSPFIALGTVTGAYWSGERVAKRIRDVYDLSDLKSGGSEE